MILCVYEYIILSKEKFSAPRIKTQALWRMVLEQVYESHVLVCQVLDYQVL